MISKNVLRQIVIEQNKTYNVPSNYIYRDISKVLLQDANLRHVKIVTGLRWIGKSTLLNFIRLKLKSNYFLNFDDERLINFTVEDFQKLLEIFMELYGDQQYFFFDEIQNIIGWERFIRRLYDTNKRVFLTGSNARILSKEMGTHLTGRYLPYVLYPVSFKEFAQYKKTQFDLNKLDTMQKVQLVQLMNEYIKLGGIPYYMLNPQKDYIKTIYNDVLYRDIVARFKLSKIKALRSLGKYLFSNYANIVSLRKLQPVTHLKSTATIATYMEHFQTAYLLFEVDKYSYSIRNQINAPKKVYLIDLSFADIIGFSFSDDIGRKLENLVFLELMRRGYDEIFYYRDRKIECDFVIQQGIEIVKAIQVTYELSDQNRDREINGILSVLKKSKIKVGLIITFEQEDEIKVDGKIIKVVPIYKWLLQNEND